MAAKTKKRKKKRLTGYARLDAEQGRKRRDMEAKEGKLARKRLKEFTTITPAGKKTQWYY